MTKQTRLRKEAREIAKFRGHRMRRTWTLSQAFGRRRQSIPCLDCGMHAIIDLSPISNGIDICGQAVALHCPGKGN